MIVREEPFFFECRSERLPAIVAHPDSVCDIGVLIIVGGPQYRVGSHRQFVLLAREIAGGGVPSMRFDFRGSGDATGEQRTYEDIGEDIAAAIDVFFQRVPQLKRVVLWGLCGAASAALFYAYRDRRVAGLALVNPWVRTEEGIARTYLRHYYVERLRDRQFWIRLLRGEVDLQASASSLGTMVRDAVRGSKRTTADRSVVVIDPSLSLPSRMAAGLANFAQDVLIILSGADYTAQEFRMAVAGSAEWERALARNRVLWHEIAEANHTFARSEWRDEVATVTLDWTLRLANGARPVLGPQTAQDAAAT